MVVKDFIPVSDAKISVEKQVKQRPSIEELTTIESPGRPISAAQMEQNRKRGARKSSSAIKGKKTEEKSEEPRIPKAPKEKNVKKDSILIITEKPQAAQKIAAALGDAKKYTDDGVSFFELERNNEKIIVASAVGHLFGLTYSKGQKGWPIFKLEWVPSYETKSAAFTKRYYTLLQQLARRSKEFIIATDFDVEGEVIGWNVLRFICNQKTAKRMKYSTLTAPELEQSYEHLLPEPAWGSAYAGETRHKLDWLYGINLSRALMEALKKTGLFRIMSIGRVQGPALKIIVDREKEIEAFKPEPYWQVFANVKDIENIDYKHPKDIFDKKELDKFKGIKEAEAETKHSEEKILPPHPFDLTSLQREAYNLHKISPSQTLQIAQRLYLDGIISYPRTSSQKIPSSIEPNKILKKLSKNFEYTKYATRKVPIEGKKSDPAHPSIYPTGEYKDLEGQDLKLYELIVKRFIAAFADDAVTQNKRTVLIAKSKGEELKFTASGMKMKEAGWTNVYPTSMEESEIPDLNGKVKIDKIKIEEKETQPPKRYTPASLITVLEKKNLGTKATRSSIVDTLFERGYLDGKSIKATPLGFKLIQSLEKYSPIILDENLTRSMEEQMEKIEESKSGFEEKEQEIVKEAEKAITKISEEFKPKEDQIGKELGEGLVELRKEQNEAATIIQCPLCKKNNLRILFNRASHRYFVACSGYPECKNTYTLPPNSLIKKAEDKVCESCHWPKLMALRKGKRPWEFCFNKECEINRKFLEEWKAKKAAKEAKAAERAEAEGKEEETSKETKE